MKVVAINHLKVKRRRTSIREGVILMLLCGSFLCRGRGNSQICKYFFVETLVCNEGKNQVFCRWVYFSCMLYLPLFCVKSVPQKGDSYKKLPHGFKLFHFVHRFQNCFLLSSTIFPSEEGGYTKSDEFLGGGVIFNPKNYRVVFYCSALKMT